MQQSTDPAHQSIVRHHEFVQRLALRLSLDPNEAQDVAQDTFVRALEGGRRAPQALGPWLAASLRGITRNRRRGELRRAERERRAAKPEIAPVEKLAMRQEVVEAVLRLKEPFRNTVVMTYELGLTPREIAAREGIAEATVRSRLHRAHATLRSTLSLEEEAGGERRRALAVLAVSKREALRAGMLSYVAGIAALAGSVWMLSSRGGEGASASMAAYRPVVAAPHTDAEAEAYAYAQELVQPSPQEEADKARTAAAVEEHPYWQAVRAARESIGRYRADESRESAAQRERMNTAVLASPPLPSPSGLSAEIRSVLAAQGIRVEIGELDLGEDPSAERPEWASVPEYLTPAGWLDLVLALHTKSVSWEILDATVRVEKVDELMAQAAQFEFGIADLLVDPAPYFENGDPPHPIFRSVVHPGDVAVAILEQQGSRRSREFVSKPSADGTSILCSALPRQLNRAQQNLNRLRTFRQPLPGWGESGAPSRSYRWPGDREAAALVARAHKSPDGLPDAEPSNAVGILWTQEAGSLRDHSDQLVLGVHSGCVVVSARTEWLSSPKASLWLDLRRDLDGELIPASVAQEDPVLVLMSEKTRDLRRDPETLRRYLQQAVEPSSWDSDPGNRMMVTLERQLLLEQDPWLLDSIEQAVERVLGQQ